MPDEITTTATEEVATMEEAVAYNKHYITVDDQGRITSGWSDGPHPNWPTGKAVLLNDKGGYQFRLFPDGTENPDLMSHEGGVSVYLYRWDGEQVVTRTEEELEADRYAARAKMRKPDGHTYCSVIDAAGEYVDLVLVHLFKDGNGAEVREIDSYTLKEGESTVDALAPTVRPHAGAEGFVHPVWDADTSAWVESATAEEIATWELENQAPVPTEAEIRAKRDRLLAATDWTQVMDAPIDADTRKAFREYRDALRDIPEQESFPANVVWPDMPAVVKAEPDPVDDAVDELLGGADDES